MYLTLLTFCLLMAGGSAWAQCSFTVSTTVTNVSCHNGTNGSVTINVTGGATPYQYQLAEAGAGAWQSTSNVYNGLGAGTFPVSVKDANGCIRTSYITITQPSPLVITYTSSDATCVGSNNGSINTQTSGGVQPYSYSWTRDGQSFSTQQNLASLSPGNYNVVVTDANGCTATPIIPSQASAITVTGFNADGIANGSLVSPSTVTSTSMDASPGSVLFAAGYSNASGQTRTGGIPASGEFVSAADASRTFKLASFGSSNELLLRSSTDNAAGGATSGTLTFQTEYRRNYSSLYVLGTTGSGTGTVNYTVNFSDGTNAKGTITIPDWYYTGTTNVALGGLARVSRSNGAYDAQGNKFNLFELPINISVANRSKIITSVGFAWAGSGAARVNIFGISGYNATENGIRINDGPSTSVTPGVTVTSNATSNTFCTGQTVTFTASPVNGGLSPSYQWKLNGVNVGTNSATYVNSSLTQNDVVSVVMTSHLTCVTANPVSSNTIKMISGSAAASVSISVPATNICSNEIPVFTAHPVNGGQSPVYQWKVNGLNAGTNNATFSPAVLSNGDAVSVSMTSSIACAIPKPAASNTIAMAVSPTATPSVAITSIPVIPKPGHPITFYAEPQFGGSSPQYQWYKNGNPINGATSSSLLAADAVDGDYYSVKLISNYSCATVSAAMSNFMTIYSPLLSSRIGWFRAGVNEKKVELTWKTVFEPGNATFEIFRSQQVGSNFQKIGEISAIHPQIGGEYRFSDILPASGTYNYQLVQKNSDGTRTILGYRTASWLNKQNLVVMDQVSSWQVVTSDAMTYMLSDLQGRILMTGSINGSVRIAKPAARGIYLLRVYNATHLQTIKLR